ncbi:ATP synthase subunit I [Tumidithrix elongata RA019]|uniref:ATP synthase subunit I n=1 Tax=Tumidithrix elongata BACA0141 TaxID=2716417 RepID=A0AAW9PSB8_9CYAN|nr:ATP synthase subunit I [Tumidithrix elongata RA019]
MKIIPANGREPSEPATASSSVSSIDSMEEYEQLKLKLFILTIGFSAFISLVIGVVYGWNVSLNYLLGACTGVVYLRMLARGVDRLDPQNRRLGYTRFAVFVILIVIASRLKQLQILPAFLGFITYKASLLVILAQDLTREFRSPKI